MSILIKGIEKMPIVCDDCWALDEYGDYPVCRITQEQRGYNFNVREYRMDDCPLVEVHECHHCSYWRDGNCMKPNAKLIDELKRHRDEYANDHGWNISLLEAMDEAIMVLKSTKVEK